MGREHSDRHTQLGPAARASVTGRSRRGHGGLSVFVLSWGPRRGRRVWEVANGTGALRKAAPLVPSSESSCPASRGGQGRHDHSRRAQAPWLLLVPACGPQDMLRKGPSARGGRRSPRSLVRLGTATLCFRPDAQSSSSSSLAAAAGSLSWTRKHSTKKPMRARYRCCFSGALCR